ncbi:hypothetical protein C1645_823503 [Glomus cerebriforme]|uniref:Uncharacterized protein n=1 Tax=Glomus cerebriforme TaxID=658196 RepID=A0A397SVZ3_9GLOM|nr:hypothetical protein C1645_823503 [Glomus cerebriforme]
MNQNHSSHQISDSQPTFNQSNLEQVATTSHLNVPYVPFASYVPHPDQFFYNPPNDPFNYHIKCKEISFDIVIQLLNESFNGNIYFNQNNQNEYTFFYQRQSNGQIYQVVCEIVTPLFLNKIIYGIEIDQNFGQDQLLFTFYQKENIKFYLSQYLSYYLN